jgi:hypothetical protein
MVGTRTVCNSIVLVAAWLMSAAALAESYAVREYDSPMTVETSFVLADHSLWASKQWHSSPDYERISGSICDHVKITRLEMNIEGTPKPKLRKGQTPPPDTVRLGIRGRIKNDFGGDKLATLRFEVLSGEEVTATVNIKVPVEEDEERNFKGFATVPASVIPADPGSRLRVTMAVEFD